MILVDSDVLSQLNRPRPDPRILTWFDTLKPSDFGVAGVTVFEQFRGVEIAKGRSATQGHTLSLWWEGFLSTLLPNQLIAAQVDVLREQARLYVEPSLKNFIQQHDTNDKPIKTGGDLILAATARAMGMPIATLNVADFKQIHSVLPLNGLYDPRAGTWHVPLDTSAKGIGAPRFGDLVEERPFVEALKKVAWSWPYSLAVAQGQSATLVELLKSTAEGTEITVEKETGYRLARASDRGALIRYVRKVAASLDRDSRIALASAMLEELDELDAEPDPTSRLSI